MLGREKSLKRLSILSPYLIGFAGVVLSLHSTSRLGVVLHGDSVDYIYAARNFSAGNGFAGLFSWPPLYPFLLALIDLIGPDPLTSARYVNAGIFGAIIVLTGHLTYRVTSRRSAGVVASLLSLLAIPLIVVSRMAISEPLFILLLGMLLSGMLTYAAQPNPKTLTWCAVTVSAIIMTRYVGIVLIVAVLLLIMRCQRPFKNILAASVLFATIALLPLCLWLLRNWIFYKTLTGSRPSSLSSFGENIHLTLLHLSEWFLPLISAGLLRSSIFLSAGISLAILTFIVKQRNDPGNICPAKGIFPVVSLLSVYLVGLLAATSLTAVDRLDNRFLSPLFPLGIILISWMFVRISESIGHKYQQAFNLVAALLILSHCSQVSLYLIKHIPAARDVGFNTNYEARPWRDSELISYLKTIRIEGYYSNAVKPVYIYTGFMLNANPLKLKYNSSEKSEDLDFLRTDLRNHKEIYFAWFDTLYRPTAYQPEELAQIFNVEVVKVFADGAIFKLTSR